MIGCTLTLNIETHTCSNYSYLQIILFSITLTSNLFFMALQLPLLAPGSPLMAPESTLMAPRSSLMAPGSSRRLQKTWFPQNQEPSFLQVCHKIIRIRYKVLDNILLCSRYDSIINNKGVIFVLFKNRLDEKINIFDSYLFLYTRNV